MSIGIIGAMPEEIDILKADMTDLVVDKTASREYFSGKLYGIETTLVFSRWGKVASAMAASTLIAKYPVDSIIFVGVAGAIDDQLNIGDVVIAEELYQHDLDARPLFKQFEIPLTGLSMLKADKALSASAENSAKLFCHNEIRKIIPPLVLKEFDIIAPVCHRGIIASGDAFIATNAQKQQIEQAMPKVLAVEMEGAAVAQVCVEHNIPFTVVRTISDKADHSAHIDFPRFISQVARHYSRSIIQSMYLSFLRRSEKKIRG
ncbi:MAG TPA: 5'-methylthioadenosine/adenosylhomocysteine nucleosidase [Gammaproteobacteria bacterium]|nr:5'-methylthioadenosine/adenosylhomocysteine nucleosidase [Gammaproteobacteria bacterium]